METLFDQYKELNINGSLICLEQVEDIYSYFCYPTNAKAIGFEGSIMYCFIEPYGEMVFACNPDTCADVFVYPLARTFEDFMRLILACGSTNPIEQIIWMDKDKFEKHLKEEEAIRTEEQKATLSYLETELEISPIDNPYDYVKELQSRFDNTRRYFLRKQRRNSNRNTRRLPGMRKPPPTLPSTQTIRTVPKRSCKRSRKRFWKKLQP